MELTIPNIKDIVRLIQKVNCQNYALISEVAKEMGVKKTQVMMYIESHPKLFILVEVKKGDKVQGLGIKTVYTDASQNPETEEWLNLQKNLWEKKIHIFAQYYYGQLEFYHIAEDSSAGKRNLYRNTPEKIQELEEAGLITKSECWYGGFSDSYKIETYRVNSDVIKKIEDAGWTTDWEEVLEENKKD